jgi:hypothetical protein
VKFSCELCKQETAGGESCLDAGLHFGGVELGMIRYGDEEWFAKRPPVGHCHACGVLPGGFHHPGCAMARCPRCGGQLISCECHYDEDD